jgi:hypothetical protein
MRTLRWPFLLFLLLVAAAGVYFGSTLAGDDSSPTRPVQPPPSRAIVSDFHNPAILRNTLPGTPPKKRALQQRIDRAEQIVEAQPDPRPRPTGGAQAYSFRTAFAGTPYGRGGGQKRLVVIHCTVSPNRPGWDDVYGVKRYLDRVGLSASWIIDMDGHVLKTMPTSGTPYTQGRFFNQYSVSVELVSTCQESRAAWLRSPLFTRRLLAAWLADRLREIGAPFRRVDPAGCSAPLGYGDHASLECVNDHTDISYSCRNGGHHPRDYSTPPCSFPWDVLARQLADGPDAPNRKLAKWQRSHRIAHARLRARCRGGERSAECQRIRERSRRLHRLIARERARAA